jgi:hypothetical protein
MRNKPITSTVQDIVSDTFSEFECLEDELQRWYDNLPEQFQGWHKSDELEEAIDLLGRLQHEEPTVNKPIGKLEVTFTPRRARSRRNNSAH